MALVRLEITRERLSSRWKYRIEEGVGVGKFGSDLDLDFPTNWSNIATRVGINPYETREATSVLVKIDGRTATLEGQAGVI